MKLPRYKAYKESGVPWLGEIPEHWELAPLKRLLHLQNGADHKPVQVDSGVPVFGSGGVFAFASMPMYDGESVLLGRKGTIDKPLYVNGPFWTVDTMYWSRVSPEAFPRFAYYAATTIPFSYYSTNTALPSMTKSALAAHLIAFPSYEEQCAIASFLDRENATIDALIAEQKRLIALLQEKRQSVISHAVTKGMNSETSMRDSGVDWLGEIPAHWDVSQLRYVVRDGTSITYGIVQAGPHIEDGVPYIKTSDMSGSSLPLDGYSRTTAEIDSSYARSKVSTGDLVIAIRASVGKCLPVPPQLDGANLTQGTAKISPGDLTHGAFLLAYINALQVQTYLSSVSKGATFKEITLDTLRRTPVLLPPIDEQRLIASQLDSFNRQFQELIDGAKTTEALLLERRSALVSAAVTGQIDVREAA